MRYKSHSNIIMQNWVYILFTFSHFINLYEWIHQNKHFTDNIIYEEIFCYMNTSTVFQKQKKTEDLKKNYGIVFVSSQFYKRKYNRGEMQVYNEILQYGNVEMYIHRLIWEHRIKLVRFYISWKLKRNLK